MAKQPDPINPFIPAEIDAAVRARIEANPGGDVTPQTFYVRCFHNNDPTKQRGEYCGRIDYTVFSEEVAAERFRLAGDFTGQICCTNSAKVRGTVREFTFSISPTMLPRAAAPVTPAAPAAAGLGGTPPTGSNVLDVLLPMFLESQRQQGQLLIAMATRPAPTSGMSDTLMSTILGHALTKSPVADVVALAEKLSGKMGEQRDDEDDDGRGGGMGVELVRTLRQMLRLAEKSPAGGFPTPTPAPTPTPNPHEPNPPTAAQDEPAKQPTPTTTHERPAGEQRKVNPAELDDVGKLRLFGSRVVPQLIDFATDPAPSVAAAASMIEATALRSGLDPEQFADADSLEHDVLEPVVGFYPELAPHKAFALAALEAVAEQYTDDDEEPGE